MSRNSKYHSIPHRKTKIDFEKYLLWKLLLNIILIKITMKIKDCLNSLATKMQCLKREQNLVWRILLILILKSTALWRNFCPFKSLREVHGFASLSEVYYSYSSNTLIVYKNDKILNNYKIRKCPNLFMKER